MPSAALPRKARSADSIPARRLRAKNKRTVSRRLMTRFNNAKETCRAAPSRPQGRDCLGALHARDPTFRPRAASREASAGPVVQPLHSLEGGEARQTRRSVHRAKAALGLVKSPTVIDGIRSESQVRTRLTAGGRRIRTIGPPSEGFMQAPRSPPIASTGVQIGGKMANVDLAPLRDQRR
jgi:hypothetical protein